MLPTILFVLGNPLPKLPAEHHLAARQYVRIAWRLVLVRGERIGDAATPPAWFRG